MFQESLETFYAFTGMITLHRRRRASYGWLGGVGPRIRGTAVIFLGTAVQWLEEEPGKLTHAGGGLCPRDRSTLFLEAFCLKGSKERCEAGAGNSYLPNASGCLARQLRCSEDLLS